jgi:hypothetical protein
LVIAPLPIPLRRLLRWAGSDKETPGLHEYGRTYGELFRSMKYRRTTLLEIGILNGNSLLAWQAFFPFGSVVGCDIEPKPELAGPRRRIFQTDQSSAPDLQRVVREEGPFDIIIDDGSHRNAHQLFTFQELFSSLRTNGVYIIEDVQTSFWPAKVGRFYWDGAKVGTSEFEQTCVGHFCELAKYVNYAEFVPGQETDRLKAEALRESQTSELAPIGKAR